MPDVLVPLAAGCEELEAVTIIDLLRRADIEVVTAGLEDGPLVASRGVGLVPDTTLEAIGERLFDLVVLPGGGPGAKRLGASPLLAAVLRAHRDADRWIGAICAAPGVLARQGLLDGKRATAYPGVLGSFAERPIQPVEETVVVDGRIVTSRGPGTAMDFALALIAILTDEARAARVEHGLQRPAAHRRFPSAEA